jgi:hypothetical protein
MGRRIEGGDVKVRDYLGGVGVIVLALGIVIAVLFLVEWWWFK